MRNEQASPGADILVVDDTPANLQLLVGILKERGHRVRPVLSGALALDAARRQPPELILLDINMPEMDGYEVCGALKADPRLTEVPVIFISPGRYPSGSRTAAAGDACQLRETGRPGAASGRAGAHDHPRSPVAPRGHLRLAGIVAD